jgi:hypothetical protein
VNTLTAFGWQVTVHGSAPECERNLRELHGHRDCKFIQGDLFALPFADRSFDLVTAVRLVSHVEAWQRLFAEMCRVAGKWVVIDYPSTAGLNALTPLLFGVKKGFEGNTRSYRSFSRREIESAFAANGFRRGRMRKQFFLPMVVHRALDSSAPVRLAESVSRAIGLTALGGSPVILRADRGGP